MFAANLEIQGLIEIHWIGMNFDTLTIEKLIEQKDAASRTLFAVPEMSADGAENLHAVITGFLGMRRPRATPEQFENAVRA